MAMSKNRMKDTAYQARTAVAAILLGKPVSAEIKLLVPDHFRLQLASLSPEIRRELAEAVGIALPDRMVTKAMTMRFSEIRPQDYKAPTVDPDCPIDEGSGMFADQMKNLPFANLDMFGSRRERGLAKGKTETSGRKTKARRKG